MSEVPLHTAIVRCLGALEGLAIEVSNVTNASVVNNDQFGIRLCAFHTLFYTPVNNTVHMCCRRSVGGGDRIHPGKARKGG